MMGMTVGFDRAMSKDMDNTVGDLRKRSKIINAEENAFDFGALAFTSNTVRGDRVAVAA